MAIQNHPSLYTAGNVQFDSTPSVNLYGQILQRKQAKAEALDEYDKQRMNSINAQGVRDVDREGFDKRLQDIRDFYNTNKDKIRKAGTPESYEYEKLFRNVGSYINQSKERTAKQDAAMKFYQEKLKQDGRIPDDFIEELHVNDTPIDTEGSKTLDLVKWLSQPKPYNQQAALKGYADIKRTPNVRLEKMADDPLKMTEITEESFDNGAKQVIAVRAANDFQNSHSFSDAVLTDIKDPVTRGKLEQVFKESYGTMPTSNEDYAAAYRIQELQPKITKTKVIDNKSAITDRSEAFRLKTQAIAEAGKNSRFYAGLNRQRPGLGDYDILSLYDPKVQEVEIEQPIEGKDWLGRPKTAKKKVTVLYKKDIDGNDEKYFEGATPYRDKNDQPYYIRRENGDYEGNGGKVVQRTTAAIKFMGNPAAYKGGVLTKEPVTRLPKDIKNTRVAPKYKGLDKNGNPIFE